MQIVSRNKAEILQDLRAAMLTQCDPDIQAAFSTHHYTVEPLLMQLIREMRLIQRLLEEHAA